MSYYLHKFKGKYRLLAEIDANTNDFPRDEDGRIEDYDVYIKCKKGRIYHYGRNILVCYVPSLGTGRNVLKALGEDLGIDLDKYFYKSDKNTIYDYENFYLKLMESNIVFDLYETDSEVFWKFKEKDIELMAKHMQASEFGANISPFSTRNLPKSDYAISDEDLRPYKEITSQVGKDNLLLITRLTKEFMSNIMSKSKAYRGKNLAELQKKKMMRNKEFIHSEGFWNEYLAFLKENISM